MVRYQQEMIKTLKEKGLVAEEDLNKAARAAEESGLPLARQLVDMGVISEQALLKELSAISGMPFVDLYKVDVEDAAVRAVPSKITWHYRILPINIHSGMLTVACSWPLSISVQDELRLMLGYKVDTVLARSDQIEERLKRNYGLGSETVGKMMESRGDTEEAEPDREAVEDIEKMAEDASVIKLVNQIILEAYKKRATDIHIEPYRDKLRLRYRVDGVLQDQKVPEKVDRFIMPILSRIKVMSNLNIVERRLPQDGRAIVRTQDGMLDLRVSFMPTPHGESVVIRILPTNVYYSLSKLGLTEEELREVRTLIKKPSGIIFVTGPTGSGKTTTLYACIKEVDKKNRKIITIEDPIEYEIEDVTQIQVNKPAGLTFARGLRSMLRHDPDIMMVGEVRDKETAEIAIRVALTGHLVFSTLHTNSAVGGVTRLLDIGIEPYLVASSVQAFIAQRLVRVLCPDCRVEDPNVEETLKDQIKEALGLPAGEEARVYGGAGCENCDNTGFRGRTAIYEILPVSDNIRRLITEGASPAEIQTQALAEGMKTLLHSGWEKVQKGETTPEEVLTVCQDAQPPKKAPPSEPVRREEHISEGELVFKISESGTEVPPGEDDGGPEGDNRRLHKRLNINLPMQYRLIEKGQGDIIKLSVPSSAQDESDPEDFGKKIKENYKTLMAESSFLHTKIAEEKFKKDIYKGSASISCNISAGGMLFETPYSIPLGSVLDVVISLSEKRRNIRCLAKVVRVEKDLPRGFRVAVSFLDSTGEERRLIDDFVTEKISAILR